MKIETKLLRPVVAAAYKLSGKRASLPILNHLLLDGQTNPMRVSATDIDLYSEAIVDCSGAWFPPACVPAGPFSALVDSAGEFIDIEADKSTLVIKSDGWTRRMSTLPALEFPQRPTIKGMKQQAAPAHLLADAIEAVAWAGEEAPSDNRWLKTVVLVEMGAKTLKTTATRCTVLAHTEQKVICSDLRWHLILKAVPGFCAALRGEEVQLFHSEERIAVVHKSGFFSAVLPTESWPDYAQLLKGERIALGSCAVAPLRAALERAITVYPTNYAAVTLAVQDGVWTLTTDPGTDVHTEALTPTKNNAEKHSVRFNASFMVEALKQLDDKDEPAFSLNPEGGSCGSLILLECGDLTVCVAKMKPL